MKNVIDANVVSLEAASLADAEGLSDLLEHYACRESATNDLPEHLDIAEFFVVPAHRGRDVGCRAAFLLWDRLPGPWVVRVSQANVAAVPFWRSTVESYTGGAFTVSERPGQPASWYVFSFRSTRRV